MVTWEEVMAACSCCQKCSLGKTRTNVVIGVGNVDSLAMFVGEGPGYYEDMQGEPFVGKAGKLLDKMLGAVELDRSKVYITNIVKCRPPNNRDPLPEEREACINYLRCQFLLIKPKIIVCLGRISAQTLIDTSFKITRDRGKWYEKKGIYLTGTFHPSYLLRNEGEKRAAWEDFKSIKLKMDSLNFL